RPDFVHLDALRLQTADGRIVMLSAGCAMITQQFFDGHASHASDPGGSSQTVAFHEDSNNLGAVSGAQAVHTGHYTCSSKYCQGVKFAKPSCRTVHLGVTIPQWQISPQVLPGRQG